MPEMEDGTQGLPQKPTSVSIPPTPFSHKGRRGSLGVLMPETEDGTQGLPQQPSPVSLPPHSFSHKGRRGTLGVLIPFFPHSPARLSCTQGREIGRPDEPKRGCVRSHDQTAGRPSCSIRRCASRFPSDSHNQEKGRMRVEPFIVLTTGADVPVAAVPNRRARTPSTHLQTRERAAS